MNITKKNSIQIVTILLFVISLITAATYTVSAQTSPVWTGTAFSNTGSVVTTSNLDNGAIYRIDVSTKFWYDYNAKYEADAMYYTTTTTEWNWGNHFKCPGGHSFLQINGKDVDWGNYGTGDNLHKYSLELRGTGAPITFQIYDWIDQNFSNNNCHIDIAIYLIQNAPTPSPSPTSEPTYTPQPTQSTITLTPKPHTPTPKPTTTSPTPNLPSPTTDATTEVTPTSSNTVSNSTSILETILLAIVIIILIGILVGIAVVVRRKNKQT